MSRKRETIDPIDLEAPFDDEEFDDYYDNDDPFLANVKDSEPNNPPGTQVQEKYKPADIFDDGYDATEPTSPAAKDDQPALKQENKSLSPGKVKSDPAASSSPPQHEGQPSGVSKPVELLDPEKMVPTKVNANIHLVRNSKIVDLYIPANKRRQLQQGPEKSPDISASSATKIEQAETKVSVGNQGSNRKFTDMLVNFKVNFIGRDRYWWLDRVRSDYTGLTDILHAMPVDADRTVLTACFFITRFIRIKDIITEIHRELNSKFERLPVDDLSNYLSKISAPVSAKYYQIPRLFRALDTGDGKALSTMKDSIIPISYPTGFPTSPPIHFEQIYHLIRACDTGMVPPGYLLFTIQNCRALVKTTDVPGWDVSGVISDRIFTWFAKITNINDPSVTYPIIDVELLDAIRNSRPPLGAQVFTKPGLVDRDQICWVKLNSYYLPVLPYDWFYIPKLPKEPPVGGKKKKVQVDSSSETLHGSVVSDTFQSESFSFSVTQVSNPLASRMDMIVRTLSKQSFDYTATSSQPTKNISKLPKLQPFVTSSFRGKYLVSGGGSA